MIGERERHSYHVDDALIIFYHDADLLFMESAMNNLITEIVAGEPYQYYPLGEYVVRAPGICGGRPTFKYTRIEITGALERLAAGEHADTIVAGYQGRVSHAALREAAQIVTAQFLSTLPDLAAA